MEKDKDEINKVYGTKDYERILSDLMKQLNCLIDQYEDNDAKLILQQVTTSEIKKAF